MQKRDIIIIGGGASGLMCAQSLYIRGKQSTILEADVKVGKKLLKTGNGRCNLTNGEIKPISYNQNIDRFLKQFNVNQTLQFFNYWGLETYKDSENRYYPKSNLSSSVLEIFLDRLEYFNTEILTETKVESIKKVNGQYELTTNKGVFVAKNLVIAVGGESAISLTKDLKIKCNEFRPSLCSMKVKENLQELNGIRQDNVKVTIEWENFFNYDFGEVLFKENAISGICIFNLSALMARNNIKKAKLRINLMPEKSEKELMDMCVNRKNVFFGMTAGKMFNGLFHKNLGREILKRSDVDEKSKIESLTIRDLERVVENIRNFSLNVIELMDNEQVHTGGVLLSELKDTLEVKNNANLFVCGEVVDVDGLCGGYNLQWAWTSGAIVGENINKK